MKNIYLTIALLFSIGFAIAQSNLAPTHGAEVSNLSKSDMVKISNTTLKHVETRNLNNKAINTRWFGYGFAMADFLGGSTSKASANNVWPDTTVLVNYSSGYSGPWIHAIAESLDPTSYVFDDPTKLKINKYTPYNVDSIAFYCFYSRVASQASAVDSITFQFQIGAANGQYKITSSWISVYNTDTLFINKIKHDALVNHSTLPTYISYSFPLTAAMANDTLSNGVNYFTFPINLSVPAGSSVACAIQYTPKGTWIPNVDTITKLNHMRFISYEENGENTDLTYVKGDENCSYILPQNKMYKATSLDYSASYFYYPVYSYEHHWVEFLLTADETGIANTTPVNNLKVSQNQPNPFNGSTTINYTLDKTSNVNITIYNVTGAQVQSINQGLKTIGNHSIKIDGSSLKAGVYYYTITADNNSVTKKMIVY